VTSQDLLKGMWFSLESCGEKLQAARGLFEQGLYGSSTALTIAARDEFGKARLLRDLWRDAAAGTAVPMEKALAICGGAKGVKGISHIQKQRAAMATITLRDEPGLGAAIERTHETIRRISALRDEGATVDDPKFLAAYDEYHAAEAVMQQILEAKRCRVPGERVDLRERGLYVDAIIEAAGVRWSRPNEVTYAEAQDALMDAINDYWGWMTNLQPPFNAIPDAGGSPEFAAALAAWTDKPALPEIKAVRYRTSPAPVAVKASPEGT